MSLSWFQKVKQFKSPIAVIAAFLLRSRETLAKKVKSKNDEIQKLNAEIRQMEKVIQQQQQSTQHAQARVVQLELENQKLRQQPLTLPDDPSLPHHCYGPRLISLCVNLTRRIGLRATPDVLKTILDWMGVEVELPHWTTVRTWVLRVGVAAIERPIEEADDWILLADHSCQVGPEKVLSILGVRASQLPPAGQPLTHGDVRVLKLQPGVSWKREDVEKVYQELAEQCGNPLAVLSDGAPELRDGAKILHTSQENGKDTLILGDFKHFAANVLKKTVGRGARFAEFMAQMGRTGSAIRQTELAHFAPPGAKPKARFMNLAAILNWGAMVSWQLAHPDSQAREDISAERMNEKLGWLTEFHDDLPRWGACQKVISASLTFINEQGVFPGASRELRAHLRQVNGCPSRSCAPDDELVRRVTVSLLRFVRESELGLETGQRLPLSTEILESSFGLFKQLEGQQSKGGFTSLLAGYGCLFQASTPESIRQDFAQVSVKQMRQWVSSNLGKTLTSKRKMAYHESRSAA